MIKDTQSVPGERDMALKAVKDTTVVQAAARTPPRGSVAGSSKDINECFMVEISGASNIAGDKPKAVKPAAPKVTKMSSDQERMALFMPTCMSENAPKRAKTE